MTVTSFYISWLCQLLVKAAGDDPEVSSTHVRWIRLADVLDLFSFNLKLPSQEFPTILSEIISKYLKFRNPDYPLLNYEGMYS